MIMHVDADSYFASVEQQANPFFRGKPLGVVKAEGRGCIIAASKEAKKLGIKTGTTVWEAKKIYPNIILVPADFWKYFSITEQFLGILKSYTPILEVFSLDEAFLELDRDAFEIALDIKRRIKIEIGEWITVSIGISYNKLLAKLAGEVSKPDGLLEINKDNLDFVLSRAKLSDFCGIGMRLEPRLKAMGVKNILNLRKISLNDLIRIFGDFRARKLYNMSYGIDNTPVIPYQDIPYPKSVSRTFTLFKDETDTAVIRKTIYNLCLEAGAKLRTVGMAGRLIALYINYHTTVYGNKVTRKIYTNDGEEIFKICCKMYNDSPARFIGVYVGLLERTCNLPMSIFEEDRKRDIVLSAMDTVNNKYGDFTIYPARLLGNELIRPEVNGFFGDKKIRMANF